MGSGVTRWSLGSLPTTVKCHGDMTVLLGRSVNCTMAMNPTTGVPHAISVRVTTSCILRSNPVVVRRLRVDQCDTHFSLENDASQNRSLTGSSMPPHPLHLAPPPLHDAWQNLMPRQRRHCPWPPPCSCSNSAHWHIIGYTGCVHTTHDRQQHEHTSRQARGNCGKSHRSCGGRRRRASNDKRRRRH